MSIELCLQIGFCAFMGSMLAASHAKIKRLERVIDLQETRYRILAEEAEHLEAIVEKLSKKGAQQ